MTKTTSNKTRIFDCFTLFNELDLLELRLAELWDVVDVFVIAEANVSFSGNEKQLCFAQNRSRFARFDEKIRYLVVDDMPMDGSSWDREAHQRNRIADAI